MDERLEATRRHMRFLLCWGLTNGALSGLAVLRGGKRRHLHEHNVFCNAVTLATYAGLRRYLLRELYAADRPSAEEAEDLARKTRTALVFSLGLDLGVYPYAGGLLRTMGELRDSERLRRYGLSMWLQGLVHITNSVLWLRAISKIRTPDAGGDGPEET